MSTFLVYLCQDASEVSASFRTTPTPNVVYSFSYKILWSNGDGELHLPEFVCNNKTCSVVMRLQPLFKQQQRLQIQT